MALSSIVLSRRCGLVCAKSSEIIDTSSSTLATWSSRDAISFFRPPSFVPFPRDSFYRVTCTACLPISCLLTGYDRSSESDDPNKSRGKCILFRTDGTTPRHAVYDKAWQAIFKFRRATVIFVLRHASVDTGASTS